MESATHPYQWLLVALAAVCIVVASLAGFWPNGQWGISDWDYYFSYHTAVRRMVVDYGVFPQWNPYICGGTSAIGDPEFPLFAPTFLLELLFGIPLGFRLAIFSVTSFGALGMVLLGKRLGLSPPGALLAAVVFSLSSVHLLEIVEGHPNVFSAFYLPWIFWAWINAYVAGPVAAIHPHTVLDKLRALWGAPGSATRSFWILACGIFLALTFFQGGIYMLMYVGMAFIFLITVLPHHRRALLVTLGAVAWSIGLTAVKLIPVALWLRQFQDKAYASSTYILPSLHKILLGRYPHGSENIIPNQGGGWHEYGAYIGIVALVLAIVSLWKIRERRVQLLWFGALVAVLIASAGPLLKPLFDQVSFLPRSNISRLMVLAVLPLALLAGYGLNVLIPRRIPRLIGLVLTCLLISLAALDVGSYTSTLTQQAFILDPVPSVLPPPAPIAYTIDEHTVRVNGVDHSRAYAGAAVGYGTMSYCTVLGPAPAVRTIQDPEDSSYLSVSDNAGPATLVSWSPQRVVVETEATKSAKVIVNANYAEGWMVNGQPARNHSERLAADIPAGTHTLTFAYQAPGFRLGVAITLLTILAALGVALLSFHHKVRKLRA